MWLGWTGIGQAREHRVVTKAARGTHVHHKNGVRDDNRPENLEVLEPSDHMQVHRELWSGSYRTLSERRCVICGDAFHPVNAKNTTCRSLECVREHHRQAAEKANQKRWEGKKIMTPEERIESARASRRRWKERNK